MTSNREVTTKEVFELRIREILEYTVEQVQDEQLLRFENNMRCVVSFLFLPDDSYDPSEIFWERTRHRLRPGDEVGRCISSLGIGSPFVGLAIWRASHCSDSQNNG